MGIIARLLFRTSAHTMSEFWRCPSCRQILKKDIGTIRMLADGRPDVSVGGFVTCGGCRSEYEFTEVYGGRYDVPVADVTCKACNTRLRGPVEELIGHRCPSCAAIIPLPEYHAILKLFNKSVEADAKTRSDLQLEGARCIRNVITTYDTADSFSQWVQEQPFDAGLPGLLFVLYHGYAAEFSCVHTVFFDIAQRELKRTPQRWTLGAIVRRLLETQVPDSFGLITLLLQIEYADKVKGRFWEAAALDQSASLSGLLKLFVRRSKGVWTHRDWLNLLNGLRATGLFGSFSDDDVGRLLETEKRSDVAGVDREHHFQEVCCPKCHRNLGWLVVSGRIPFRADRFTCSECRNEIVMLFNQETLSVAWEKEGMRFRAQMYRESPFSAWSSGPSGGIHHLS